MKPRIRTESCSFRTPNDWRHCEWPEIATRQRRNVPQWNTRDPPTPAVGHLETSGAIYNNFIPSCAVREYLSVFLLPPLSCFPAHCCHGARNQWHHRGRVCARHVCLCGDESWNPKTEWTRPAKHQVRSSSSDRRRPAGAHAHKSKRCTHVNTASSYRLPPAHLPTHTHTQPICHSHTATWIHNVVFNSRGLEGSIHLKHKRLSP